jgi:hypothetical protein
MAKRQLQGIEFLAVTLENPPEGREPREKPYGLPAEESRFMMLSGVFLLALYSRDSPRPPGELVTQMVAALFRRANMWKAKPMPEPKKWRLIDWKRGQWTFNRVMLVAVGTPMILCPFSAHPIAWTFVLLCWVGGAISLRNAIKWNRER